MFYIFSHIKRYYLGEVERTKPMVLNGISTWRLGEKHATHIKWEIIERKIEQILMSFLSLEVHFSY